MQIRLLTEQDYAEYEKFLKSFTGSMLYYTIKYKQFLEKLLHAESLYFIAVDKNKITGVLPLMIKSGSLGKVINSLPYYGSNGGILSKDSHVKNELTKFYNQMAVSSEYAAATLIENPLDKNYPYNLLDVNESDYRIGQLTNIKGSYENLEELMVLFHHKTRNTIRKAIKSDVKVSIENHMLEFLEETHKNNMESIGGLAKSHRFFLSIPELFRPDTDFRIYVAKLENIPIAALLIFSFNKVVEYYTPVIVKEYRHLQPLSLLIAQTMFDYSANGFEWWNWGGTWATQSGVYDFKSRWSTQDFNYHYYIKINNPEIYTADKAILLSQYEGFYVLPFASLKIK